MTEKQFDRILRETAKQYNTTPEHVRQEMQLAMDEAMRNPDPTVQAKWASIPRKGDVPTLEEFVEHMAILVNTIRSFS